VPHPLCYVSCFSTACLLFSFFSFFPGQGSVCPGGYAALSQGVPCATYLLTLRSPKQCRNWHLAGETLLVSPFNVAGGCYAQAGGVEVSEFCFFLVVFLARCISSISPRVYFRKHAFCFLPLVAILESSEYALLMEMKFS
jgi:hypothetical protein